MATEKTVYELIDFSKLDPLCSNLPPSERQALYRKMTEEYTVTSHTNKNDETTYTIDGLSDDQIAWRLPPIPFKTELQSIIFFFVFMGFFWVPVLFLLLGVYLLYHRHLLTLGLYALLYAALIAYPIREHKEILQNRLFFSILSYFGYHHVCAKECHEFVTSHLQKTHKTFHTLSNGTEIKADRPLIFMSIPHGIVPMASVLSPLVSPDIFGTAAVGTVASVVFYIPFIRNIVHWYGARSVSRKSLSRILSLGRHVGLVCDGIRGMFVNSREAEHVLLRHRKGVAKVALQNGVHVVPTYGFGNTSVFASLHDRWGVMQWLSSKLKASVIVFFGRWLTPVPRRVPLLFCVGKPVYNRHCYAPIAKPTQQQIDEYHTQILEATQELFDANKALYGWQKRQLVFV